jgi:hypothetical protein
MCTLYIHLKFPKKMYTLHLHCLFTFFDYIFYLHLHMLIVIVHVMLAFSNVY